VQCGVRPRLPEDFISSRRPAVNCARNWQTSEKRWNSSKSYPQADHQNASAERLSSSGVEP